MPLHATHLTRPTRSKLAALLLAACFLTSCMSTRIVTIPNDCAAMAKDPNNTVVRKSYWWGLQKQEDFNPQCDPRSNHLNAVEVRTSFGQYVLAGVTLGIVLRQHLWWCCTPYRPDVEPIGPR
jgi:hypothetical protein